jgi:GT2 family glycosyltransferase
MIGFVILAHYSKKFRPNGKKFFKLYVESLQEFCQQPYLLIIADNGSEENFNCDGIANYEYVRVENQMTGGFPAIFNGAIKRAIKNNCQLIHLVNDDVIFNETINIYNQSILDHIDKDISVFGPTTNGVSNKKQLAEKLHAKGKGIKKVNSINGFFMSFTDKFCQRFAIDKEFKLFADKPKFGGAEHAGFQSRVSKSGAKIYVIQDAWFEHRKMSHWKKLK